MNKNYRTRIAGSNLYTIFKIIGLSSVIWISLANFALVPHWINEMVGATPLNTMFSELIIFGSIFVFATMLAFIFFNRLFALVPDFIEEGAS